MKNYGTTLKTISPAIHMGNMEAVSFIVIKLLPRFKFMFTPLTPTRTVGL